ncbi:MAG: hypothetical protein C0501_07145 [Isosphaera sp.]|nr:hypothetical protein [Isosphaera sp.]
MTPSPPPPAPPTRYDQLARYLLTKAGGGLFPWLLGVPPGRLRFGRWLPAQLTLPNTPERLCDAVAEVFDLDRGGAPVAVLLEVQTEPDPTMPGRLTLAGGLLWLTVKPSDLPGDRYDLVGAVINLTGTGDTARSCVVGGAEWTLRPAERNLSTTDAGAVLDEIAAGTAPKELLAFVPLMHGGAEDDTIRRWRGLVAAESDPVRRGDFALARVFADKVGRGPAWQAAVEGLPMEEAPVIAELLATHGAKVAAKAAAEGEARGLAAGLARGLAEGKTEGRVQGVAEGKAEGKADALLRLIAKRFGAVPEEVAAAVRACTDTARLDRLLDDALDDALDAASLDRFRARAGL